MFKNYLLVALRNIYRNKLHTFINLTGFSLGLAVVILIGRFVYKELSTDKFHQNINQVYFVKTLGWFTPYVLAPTMKDMFPEVESTLRFDYFNARDAVLNVGNDPVTVEDLYYADSTFFDFFNFNLIYGNPEKVLISPNSIVLTKKMAFKLFGDTNPMGNTIRFNNKLDLTVTGVLEDIPTNSSIFFNGLISFNTLYQLMDPERFESWWMYVTNTMIKVNEHADINRLISKMKPLAEEHQWDEFDVLCFKDLHFFEEEVGKYRQGNIKKLLILITIGILIFFIAVINYVNLSISTFLTRLREMMIRKIVGGSRKQLILQILIEPIILSLISMNFAIIIANLFIPEYNELVNADFLYLNTKSITFWLLFLVGSLCLGLIVGLFPGFYLTGSPSPEILRGQTVKTSGKGLFRKLLMLFQFVVSTILIVCSMIMLKQFHFIRTKDLGFNPDNIMVIPLSEELVEKRDLFVEEIRSDPNVAEYAWSSYIPCDARMMVGTDINYEGEKREALFHLAMVDDKFLDLLEFEIVNGRHFLKNVASEKMNIIMNESGVKKFELENPFNTSFPPHDEEDGGNLVGVLKDYHVRSLHKQISPMVFCLDPDNTDHLFLKLHSVEKTGLTNTSKKITGIWNDMSPNFPPEMFLLSDRIDDLYKEDKKTERVIIYFTLVAILISCLGLFGLVSFMLQQRTKEMGIRKANGALVSDLIGLILKDYLKWILLAFIIACPVAYHFMNRWLQNFAYKTGLSWWVFVLAGILFLLLTLISTFYNILRTTSTNTAESLRYE